MVGLFIFIGAIVLVFGLILFYNIRRKIKQKPKVPKEKVEKEKKEKVAKEKKKKGNNGNELLQRDKFLRPSDAVKIKREEKRKAEELKKLEEEKLKAEKEEKEIQEKKVGEGETDNVDFQGYGDRPLTEGKKDDDIEIIEPDISEEIKNLSPEMKALLFGDVLKPKN